MGPHSYVTLPQGERISNYDLVGVPDLLKLEVKGLLKRHVGETVNLQYLAREIGGFIVRAITASEYEMATPPSWRYQHWVWNWKYLVGFLVAILITSVLYGYIASSPLLILLGAGSLLIMAIALIYLTYWETLILGRDKISQGGLNEVALYSYIGVVLLSLAIFERLNVLGVDPSTLIAIDLVLAASSAIVIFYASIKRRCEVSSIPKNIDTMFLDIVGSLSFHLSVLLDGTHLSLMDAILAYLEDHLSGKYQFIAQARSNKRWK